MVSFGASRARDTDLAGGDSEIEAQVRQHIDTEPLVEHYVQPDRGNTFVQ